MVHNAKKEETYPKASIRSKRWTYASKGQKKGGKLIILKSFFSALNLFILEYWDESTSSTSMMQKAGAKGGVE